MDDNDVLADLTFEEFLHMAAAAEASSEHPLARAVLAYARSCLRAAFSTLDLGPQGASSSSHAVFHGN